MESVRERHVTPPVEKQAKNSDQIVEDKGGEQGGKTRSSGGRKADRQRTHFAETDQMATRGPRSFWLHALPAPSIHAFKVRSYKTNSGSQEKEAETQFSIYIQV